MIQEKIAELVSAMSATPTGVRDVTIFASKESPGYQDDETHWTVDELKYVLEHLPKSEHHAHRDPTPSGG